MVDEDGHISNYIGYGSNGNRIVTEGDWPPHIEPIFLDNDVLFPGFPQMKLAAGTAQDMTQQLGPLDTAGVSGLAGLGASANPDTAPGGNATFLQPALGRGMLPGAGLSDWIEREMHPFPELEQWILDSLAPPQAPPAVQDAATDADFRLAGMWREQEYYGAKPGAQQGSPWVDDQRNARLPLWRFSPAANVPINDWIDREMHPERYWNKKPARLRPTPSRGPWPMLPNADSGGSESGGTTEPRSDDTYYNAMNQAVGETNYFARPSDSGSNGGGGSAGGQGRCIGDPDPNAPWYQKLWHWLNSNMLLDEGEPDAPADSWMDSWCLNTGLGKKVNDFIETHIYSDWRNAIEADMVSHPNTWALSGGLGAAAVSLGIATGVAGAISFVPSLLQAGAQLIGRAATSAVNWFTGALMTAASASARITAPAVSATQRAGTTPTTFGEAVADFEEQLASNPATADWIATWSQKGSGLLYSAPGKPIPNGRVMPRNWQNPDGCIRLEAELNKFVTQAGNWVAKKAAEGHLAWGSKIPPNWPTK